MAHLRCSYCGTRRTMNLPEHYIRVPACKGLGCEAKRKRLGKPKRYYHDKYRDNVETGGKRKPCFPGRGGCEGYPFPHRRGSRLCAHNPRAEEVQRELQEDEERVNVF